MTKKVIELRHKVCDYACMWNGIEDLYQTRLGEDIPDYFFFCLSGIGKFVYLKFSNGNMRRMTSWNDGRTKKMYDSINDIVELKKLKKLNMKLLRRLLILKRLLYLIKIQCAS